MIQPVTWRTGKDRGRLARCLGLLALLLLTQRFGLTDSGAPPSGAGPNGLPYQIQRIARPGDRMGNAEADRPFFVESLNDQGQVVFIAENAAGGQMLVQYAQGRLTPMVVSGGEAPGGTWSEEVGILSPVSMNQEGSVLFAADVTIGGQSHVGTFRWDDRARRVVPVAVKGMALLPNLTLEQDRGVALALNNDNEVALAVAVKNASQSGEGGGGVFFFGRDGQRLPVALPEGTLPDGGKVRWAWFPSLNDAGRIAFVAQAGDSLLSLPYLWEKGELTPVPVKGLPVPPGKSLFGITGAWLNDRNRNVLLEAHLHSLAGAFYALYLLSDGQLLPVAVPGQEMPGGGRLQSLQGHGVSWASSEGRHAFLAQLQDGATAAYWIGTEGRPSLILKSGSVTPLGTIVNVGQGSGYSGGIGFNKQGQAALTVKFEDGTEAIVLLTPLPVPGPGR